MLETAVIVFREGLEAFLIVAIMLAYIERTGRMNLKQPIYTGIGIALVISATTAWHVAELAKDPVWEGSLALISGAMVASFTAYMMRAAGSIRQDIESKIEKSAAQESAFAEIGVMLFTIFMIAREGMETAIMIGTLSAQQDPFAIATGGILGAALVAFIAVAWITQSQKINVKLFMQVTGVFLILFSIELFLYGLHELSEMNAIPLIGDDWNVEFHIFTEIIEYPIISNLISGALVLVPCLWLIGAMAKDKLSSSKSSAQ